MAVWYLDKNSIKGSFFLFIALFLTFFFRILFLLFSLNIMLSFYRNLNIFFFTFLEKNVHCILISAILSQIWNCFKQKKMTYYTKQGLIVLKILLEMEVVFLIIQLLYCMLYVWDSTFFWVRWSQSNNF